MKTQEVEAVHLVLMVQQPLNSSTKTAETARDKGVQKLQRTEEPEHRKQRPKNSNSPSSFISHAIFFLITTTTLPHSSYSFLIPTKSLQATINNPIHNTLLLHLINSLQINTNT